MKGFFAICGEGEGGREGGGGRRGVYEYDVTSWFRTNNLQHLNWERDGSWLYLVRFGRLNWDVESWFQSRFRTKNEPIYRKLSIDWRSFGIFQDLGVKLPHSKSISYQKMNQFTSSCRLVEDYLRFFNIFWVWILTFKSISHQKWTNLPKIVDWLRIIWDSSRSWGQIMT